MGEPDENMTRAEEVGAGNVGGNLGAAAQICYGRNMTFPRQAASYPHRHELPAVVTEGENYRLPGDVSDDL